MSTSQSSTVEETVDDEDLEFQEDRNNLQRAKLLFNLMKGRLCILLTADRHDHLYKNAFYQDNVRTMECGLNMSKDELRSEIMKYQLLNLAVSKGIQSTLLSVTNKNILKIEEEDSNDFEKLLSYQVKLKIKQTKVISEMKERLNDVFKSKLQLNTEVASLRGIVKINQKISKNNKLEKMECEFNKINIIISVLMFLAPLSKRKEAMQYALKWQQYRFPQHTIII